MHNRTEIAYEFAEAIKSEYVKKIILFGSVARGDDTSESDIDILIIVSSKSAVEKFIADTAYNFIANYHEVVSAHLMSEAHYNRTKDYSFLSNVLKEGVVIG